MFPPPYTLSPTATATATYYTPIHQNLPFSPTIYHASSLNFKVKCSNNNNNNDDEIISSRLSAYDVLGVSPDCSLPQLKAAFRAKVKKFHPDVAGQDKTISDTVIRQVIRAYEILSQYSTSEIIERECLDPFDEPECEALDIFVNESLCIGKGCPYSCVKKAPQAFGFSPLTRTAHATSQGHGDDYQVQIAASQCPSNCIHYVTPSQRVILEELLSSIINVPYDTSAEKELLYSLIVKAKFENNRYRKPKKQAKSSTKHELLCMLEIFIMEVDSNESQGSLVLIKQGAEARVFESKFVGRRSIIKERFSKKYRHPTLDSKLTLKRLNAEARCMTKARRLGVSTPVLYAFDPLMHTLTFEYVEGPSVKEMFLDFGTHGIVEERMNDIGLQTANAIAKLHDGGLIHGDLTTSNMLLRSDTNQLVLIDFGLSFTSTLPEDKAVDLYVLERALLSMHSSCGNVMDKILASYKKSSKQWSSTVNKLAQVRQRGRKRTMVG